LKLGDGLSEYNVKYEDCDQVGVANGCSRLTLDIIGPAAIGRDFQSLENEDDPVSQNYTAILKPSADLLLLFGASLLFPQWMVKLIPCKANITLPRRVRYLRRVFHEILVEKRAQLAREKNEQEPAEGDILGTMMRGGEFSDSELVDQMLTILAAGVSRSSPMER
jgi:cytochrome P450